MNRLLEIGFQPAGHWHVVDDELSFELLRHGSQENVLYAFVSDGEVKYVGKTTQSLAKRLYGYKKPAHSQSTNIKNHANIKELLGSGAAIDILALPDNGLLHYGQFHFNLAAGLEDSIISVVQPEWNGKPKSVTPPSEREQPAVVDSFTLVLHKTYFNSGFFNVPVAHSQSFADDGQQIDIFCENALRPIIGSINRRCNVNNTPRIMGGAGLRDWLQANVAMLEDVTVCVFSPNAIQLKSSSD